MSLNMLIIKIKHLIFTCTPTIVIGNGVGLQDILHVDDEIGLQDKYLNYSK